MCWRPAPLSWATTGTKAISKPTPNKMEGSQILAAIDTAAMSIALTPPAMMVSTKPIPVCATEAISTGVASLIKFDASFL
ncbi:Uncharacterised protein [Vibrio cholerae]|nr:Uncharacterised protein [Vibrio cholerae]CSD72906.1 Uncharacterised protein [Vibrio cholerae]